MERATETMTPEELAEWEAKLVTGGLFPSRESYWRLCVVCGGETQNRRYCSRACMEDERPWLRSGVCSVEGCGRRRAALGLCDLHYRRVLRQRRKEARAG